MGDGLGGVHGDADLDGMTFRVEETKTGEPLELPVNRQFVAILQRRFAERDRFPECSQGWAFPVRNCRVGTHAADWNAADWTMEQLRAAAPASRRVKKVVDFCASCRSIYGAYGVMARRRCGGCSSIRYQESEALFFSRVA